VRLAEKDERTAEEGMVRRSMAAREAIANDILVEEL
jgi:hypothetical protein